MMHPTTAEILVHDHQRELLDSARRSRLGDRRSRVRFWRSKAGRPRD